MAEYSSKKYYWIKLTDHFLTSDTVDFLLSQKDGANYVVLYQMLCLKSVNTNGLLARQLGEIIVPFDVEKISRDCKHFSIDTIRVALELYKKLGLVYEQEDGCLRIANFDRLIGSQTEGAFKKEIQKKNRLLLQGGKKVENFPPDIRYKDIDIDIYNNNSKKERKNINKSVRTQESYDKILESSNLAEKVIDSLQTFIQHRCLIKKPLLNKELKELISTLKEQYKTDEEMVQALDKAVKGGYTYIKTEQPQTANNTAEKVNVDEELRKRKNHAESIAQDNLDKMLKDKKFKEVYEQLNSIERELAFAEMENDKEKMSYLLNQRTKVRFTGTMILQNNGFEWEDLQPHYHCEKCKDTGWIGTKECTCRKELRG